MKQIAYAVAFMLIFASAIHAQSPQPSPEQKKLLVCVGDWTYVEERRDSTSVIAPPGLFVLEVVSLNRIDK